jgi:hypothetical protein
MQVLPVAYVASYDESLPMASAWAAVWSQGCPSEPAALRLHAPELARLLAGGLGSSAWPRKRSAAKVRGAAGIRLCACAISFKYHVIVIHCQVSHLSLLLHELHES